MRSGKSEEVVFGKGFVHVYRACFSGTEEEIAQLSNLRKLGEWIHIIIDPVGRVTIKGGKGQEDEYLDPLR